MTSVENERIFSHVNLVYNKLRNRMHIDSVDTLLFIARIGPYLKEKGYFAENQLFKAAIKHWKLEKKRRKLI